MKFSFLLFFLLFSIRVGASGTSNPDSLFNKFSDFAYQFNFTKSQQIADSLVNTYPDSPLGFHANALLNMWYYLGSHDLETANVFNRFSDMAIAKFDSEIDNKETPLLDYRLGEAYLFRAILSLFNSTKIKSFWEIKKADNYFSKAHKLDSAFYDGYSGLGVISYSLAYAPSSVKLGIKLFGLNADARKGINYLRIASEKGEYSKTEAMFQLSKIYSDFYFDIDSSNIYLSPLIVHYPKNIFFKYQYAVNCVKANKLSEALNVLNQIISYKNKNFQQIIAFSFFLKGEVYFMQNKFKKAIKEYENFYSKAKDTDFIAYASYKEGLAYLLTDDFSKAKEAFFLALNGDDNNYKDKRASEKSAKILDSGLKSVNKDLIVSRNLVETGRYSEALKFINRVTADSEIELKIKLTLLSQSYLSLGKFTRANKNLILTTNLISDDKYWDAKALYLFAKYYWLLKNKSESIKFLDKAEDIGAESFEMKAKIRNLRKRVLHN